MKITTAELAHTTKYITSWVKNKTNYAPAPNRTISVSGIANIIADPQHSLALAGRRQLSNKMLIANVQFATNADTVLQINKILPKSLHNSWTVLQEGRGPIP